MKQPCMSLLQIIPKIPQQLSLTFRTRASRTAISLAEMIGAIHKAAGIGAMVQEEHMPYFVRCDLNKSRQTQTEIAAIQVFVF
jgi:hypothetical protein